MIGERTIAGVPALTLSSDAAGGVEVAFVPSAGMVGSSLRHRGEELLGQRGGLRTYIKEHSTMGIPLLHPWANRVAISHFPVAGRTVELAYAAPGDGAPFVLAGGGRRIELRLGGGYSFAQVYAPADDDVIAYEAMTAPTNALVDGGADLPLLEPGRRYQAAFSIRVIDLQQR